MATVRGVTGLTRWQASDLAQANSSEVTAWADKDAALTLGKTGTTGPTYLTSGIGGQAAVQFAASKALTVNWGNNTHASRTIVVVAKFAAVNQDPQWLTGSTRGYPYGFAFGTKDGYNPNTWGVSLATGSVVQSSSAPNTTEHIWTFRYDGTTAIIRLDGTAAGSAAYAGGINDGTVAAFLLGVYGSDYLRSGLIADVIVAPGVALSDADLASIHSEMQDVYGITTSDYVSGTTSVTATRSTTWDVAGAPAPVTTDRATTWQVWGAPATAFASAVESLTPAAFFPLDEATGTTIADAAGGSAGTVLGSTSAVWHSTVDAEIGPYLALTSPSGSTGGGRVNLPFPTTLPNGDMSFAWLLRTTASVLVDAWGQLPAPGFVANSPSAGDDIILMEYNGDSTAGLDVDTLGFTVAQLVQHHVTGRALTPTISWRDGSWHLITLTWDASARTMTIHIDRASQTVDYFDYSGTGIDGAVTTWTTDGSPLTYGPGASTTAAFASDLAGYAIFDRILTDTDVAAMMDALATTTAVTASRATTWDTRSSLTATRATTWTTAASVTADRATTWDTSAPVTATRATTWAVDALTSVTTTRATSWTTAATISASRSTTWDVDATGSVSASRATTWDTAASITADRATSWDAQTSTTTSRATTWATRTAIQAARSTTWAALAHTSATRSTTWDVQQTGSVNASRSTMWTTRAVTTADRATSWDSLVRLGTVSRATTWDVLTTVDATRLTTWAVKAAIAAQRATTWAVDSELVPAGHMTGSTGPTPAMTGATAVTAKMRAGSPGRPTMVGG